jgi:hypothetical protein
MAINMSEPTLYWFPAKKYGWGWGFPITWQGWSVFIGYFVLVGMGFLIFPPAYERPMFILYTVILTAVLIGVCYAKGEPPAWRWGRKT